VGVVRHEAMLTGGSLHMMALSHFFKIRCAGYFHRTLGRIINEAMQGPTIELNPARMQTLGEETIDAAAVRNYARLNSVVESLIHALVLTMEEIPMDVRRVLSHMRAELLRGSSDDDLTTAGLCFLARAVCSCLQEPEFYGMCESPPAEKRKILFSSWRLLFCTAVRSPFSHKRADFSVLNSFIENKAPVLHKYLEELSAPQYTPEADLEPARPPEDYVGWAEHKMLQTLANYCYSLELSQTSRTELTRLLEVSDTQPEIPADFAGLLVMAQGAAKALES